MIEKRIIQIEQLVLDICLDEPEDKVTKDYLQERINNFLNPAVEKIDNSQPKPRRGRPIKNVVERTEAKEIKEPEFFEVLEHFIATRPASTWRKKRYEVLMRALQRFEMYRKIRRIKTYKLTLRGFSVDDINDFEKFLRSEEELYEKYPKIYEKHPVIPERFVRKQNHFPKETTPSSICLRA